jgi:hypothetical protein
LNSASRPHRSAYDAEMLQVGENNKTLKDLGRRETGLLDRLPEPADLSAAPRWCGRSRFVQGAVPELATEAQLLEEAKVLADSADVSLDAMRHRIGVMSSGLPATLREVAPGGAQLLDGCSQRPGALRLPGPTRRHSIASRRCCRRCWGCSGPCRRADAPAALDWPGRQTWNGCRRRRPASMHVFTSSFCFKVRDDVKQGATTLQRLNRHLQGHPASVHDTYQARVGLGAAAAESVQEFFEAVEGCRRGARAGPAARSSPRRA